MLELLLVGCFTGFFLATVRNIVDALSLFIPMTLINAIFSVIFSIFADLLYREFSLGSISQYILYVIAGSFLGLSLLALVERISTYRPPVINSVKE